MAGGLQYTLGLSTAGFTGPLGIARSALGGFLGAASNIGNIATGIASAKGLIEGMVGTLNQPIGLAADIESLNTSFRALLKDGAAAEALVGDLMKFADKTPFEPGPVAEAGKQLLAFGNAADTIIPLLTDIGDLAAAMDKPLDQVADTFGRLGAGQFGEAFERLRSFGISMRDLQGAGLEFDKSGSFKGTAEQAMEAVRQIIRNKFGGGMDELSKTYKGLFSTLTGYWTQLQAKFGEPIMTSLKPMLEDMTGLIQEWTPEAVKFGQAIAGAMTGVRNLFQSGELGSTISTALEGGAAIFLGNIGTGVAAVIQLLGVGLKTAFSSGVALLSDGNLWSGIEAQVMGILDGVVGTLMGTMADIVDKMPSLMKLGADPEGLRKGAAEREHWAGLSRGMAGEFFGKVDWDGVMTPVKEGVAQGGAIIAGAFAEARDSIVNNPALKEAAQAVSAAAQRNPQGQAPAIAERANARAAFFSDLGVRAARPAPGPADFALNTGQLDEVMNRSQRSGSAEDWTRKLVQSSWAQTILSEIKSLRTSSEPSGAFL